MKKSNRYYVLILLALLPSMIMSAGTVYLVLGSDTAIWDGMSVNRYHNTYNQYLYTDPGANTYAVMDPAFRAQFVDSYGQTMKMTWWMMAGNIFRYATNTNVPVPNIITLHLMQKYHGQNVIINGDELSLHYHTFFWSDYDQDGLYYWNQALKFEESADDFDVTLAQFLLEENVFPVSFRSGWHFMDDAWQHRLNEILPYSMHNAWPSNRVDTIEPLDNSYNWSESPSDFIPFRPSLENYMVDGDGPGWNVRSASFQHVISGNLMDQVFSAADQGVDQVACFWAHLPESDFPENMAKIDELAQAAAIKYPDVKFRYCSAVEAMQMWRATQDTTGPVISLEAKGTASERYYTITSDEPLFQPEPFVALKFKDESYRVLSSELVSENVWNTEIIPTAAELAKVGVAATDTSGNLSTLFENILPDDIYIDAGDPGYTEYSGLWSESSEASWGTDSRLAQIDGANPVQVGWSPDIQASGNYHVFVQVPETISEAFPLKYVLHSTSSIDTVTLTAPLPAHEWIYLGSPMLDAGQSEVLELIAVLPDSIAHGQVAADVVRFSALVRDQDLRLSSEVVDFAEISLSWTSTQPLELMNKGLNSVTIESIESSHGHVTLNVSAPLVIQSMDKVELQLKITPAQLGLLSDTLTISSTDPLHPQMKVVITADVQYPFYVVDDEHLISTPEEFRLGYYEELTGSWFLSVAQAWKLTSRYAYLNQGASARFTVELDEQGYYDVFEIVPKTVNASNHALYILKVDGEPLDSMIVDQNAGSGQWVNLGNYHLPANVPISLEVHDTGQSTVSGVLRADAVKVQLIQPTTGLVDDGDLLQPGEPSLQQNFPNPFNPTTSIRYFLPGDAQVSLLVYDIMGREIMTFEDGFKAAGNYEIQWNGLDNSGNPLSTSVYFCRLVAGDYSQTIKMVYLR